MSGGIAEAQRWSLADLSASHKRSRGGDLAFVDGDERVTFAEFHDRVLRMAGWMRSRGCGQGEPILWAAQNSTRLFEVLFAASAIGAFVVPLNWRLTADELTAIALDLCPRIAFWQDTEIGDTVRAARARVGELKTEWVSLDEGDGYDAMLAAAAPAQDLVRDWDLPVLALYTAAFDGRPSAALISQRALMLSGMVTIWVQGYRHNSRFLVSGPLFHIATFLEAFAAFQAGGANIMTPRVDPAELLTLIESERATHAFLTPPTLAQMRALNADAGRDVSSLFAMPNMETSLAGMICPLSAPWAESGVLGAYGQTEVTGRATMYALGGALGAGRPHPWIEVGVFDENDREVAPGEVGEIRARGATLFSGYWNRPELNARSLRNGWRPTNDLGRYGEDGSIAFIGPKQKLIKSASENIYPAEVEGVIRTHPAVADVCVLGTPDPTWGQSVKAVVVLRPEASVDPQDIIDHVRRQIASYKKPKTVAFVEAIARKSPFEIDRDAMDLAHGGGGYPSA